MVLEFLSATHGEKLKTFDDLPFLPDLPYLPRPKVTRVFFLNIKQLTCIQDRIVRQGVGKTNFVPPTRGTECTVAFAGQASAYSKERPKRSL